MIVSNVKLCHSLLPYLAYSSLPLSRFILLSCFLFSRFVLFANKPHLGTFRNYDTSTFDVRAVINDFTTERAEYILPRYFSIIPSKRTEMYQLLY